MYLHMLFVVLVSVSAQHVHYVLPNGSSPLNCPAQPCLTLDQYTQQTGTYFTTGATFLFLAGNHSLQAAVTLTNISDVTLRGEETGSQFNIICDNDHVAVQFHSVRNLAIEKLKFVFLKVREMIRALIINSSSNVKISNCMFRTLYGNSGGAIALLESSVEILNCTFKHINDSRISGGAIYAENATLTVSESMFSGNRAAPHGGAITAINAILTVIESMFNGNRGYRNGGAIAAVNSTLTLSGSKFDGNTGHNGGAIAAVNSTLTLSGSKFDGNTGHNGGAIGMSHSHLDLKEALGNVFSCNSAEDNGGAIACDTNSTITMTRSCQNNISHYNSNSGYSLTPCWTYFYNNTAHAGGALYTHGESCVSLNGTNIEFINNKASSGFGGAIGIQRRGTLQVSGLNILFKGNEAYYDGGALSLLDQSLLKLSGQDILFEDNSAGGDGGAISIVSSSAMLKGQLCFTNNTAKEHGGAIAIRVVEIKGIYITGIFINNSCENGGAVYTKDVNRLSITLENITAVSNTGGAICIYDARVTFKGSINLTGNIGSLGGGIYAHKSTINMWGHTYIANNRAKNGGGIYSVGGYLFLNADALFSHNTADGDGGALHATGTDLILKRVNFTFNKALNGGGMFISTIDLILSYQAILTTSHNHASLYGGAIYHEDKPNREICSNPRRAISENSPKCFLIIVEESVITSYHDSAGRDGSFLYGGLLDKCRLSVHDKYNYTPYDFLITASILNITSNKNKGNEIAAMPYTLRFCDDSLQYYDKSVSISRGQRLIISIQIIEAIGITQVQQVTARPGINARVHLNQVTQVASSSNCTDLTYNFYSSQNEDELRLTTRGSCGDTGTAQLLIGVTLLPCPHPFVQDNEECACDKRLLEYPNVNCTTDEHNNSYVTKQHGSDFWMSILYKTNGSYEGLVLYKTCPPEYCKAQTVAVSMDDMDSQCDDNRGGVLCGQCLANYSLMLGSSTCTHCSNKHLALLLPFAAAGIALVIFLSFLRLTVATAMINSVILYANILQANRNAIFPARERNVLTVFIAWMNLDLGFETCFYDGMTAYAQTWLQFAFPVYVWLLISLIILSSRYSITVSRLIGHNPIAVLATLILMSYTKLLKVIIEVYSSVDLAYPDNQKVTVWLKDANMPYLQSWHLLLTVVTMLVLVLFFLPYTLLLLLGYKLYCFAGRRHLRWVHRIRPLLESYYAPYNIKTRYWTGFLLLVRCVLYIIFSTYSLENTNKSLLAINATFTGLLVFLLVISLWYSHLLYIKVHNNIMEISTYLNLIVLSAATIIGANSPALVYSLVGLIFVAMLGIIVYHFHLICIAKSQVWQQFRVKVSTLKEKLTCPATSTAAGLPVDTGKSAHDPPKMVTHSEIELREPLLQEN